MPSPAPAALQPRSTNTPGRHTAPLPALKRVAGSASSATSTPPKHQGPPSALKGSQQPGSASRKAIALRAGKAAAGDENSSPFPGASPASQAMTSPALASKASPAVPATTSSTSSEYTTPVIHGLPGRFVTPAFLQGGSDKRGSGARRRMGSASARLTPRSSMRALMKNSAAKQAASRSKPSAAATPRSAMRQFIAKGLDSKKITADTPVTSKRRALRKEEAERRAREAAAAELTPLQRLFRLMVFVLCFVMAVIVLCHMSAPVRELVVSQLGSAEQTAVRFT